LPHDPQPLHHSGQQNNRSKQQQPVLLATVTMAARAKIIRFMVR
jgi:hypothetical protein